jgi:GNAT superfamily N-acetyltransferase
MWKSDRMAVGRKESDEVGILSTKAKFSLDDIKLEEGKVIRIDEVNTRNDVFCHFACSEMDEYNPVDVDIKDTGAYAVTIEEEKTNSIIGQLISIPHTVFLSAYGKLDTVISTWLLVDPEHRSRKIAEALILGAIREGYDRNIKMGYHWVKDSKTDSGIKTLAWFRPLNLGLAKKCDYEIAKSEDYSIPRTSTKCRVYKTKHEDFGKIKSRTEMRFFPSEEALDSYKDIITFITVKTDGVVVGIVGYRKFPVVKTKLHRTNNAVQISYFDASVDHASDVMSKALQVLKDEKFVAAHGVFMSSMGKVVKSHVLSIVAPLYLDFYNFAHPEYKISDVAVLYV